MRDGTTIHDLIIGALCNDNIAQLKIVVIMSSLQKIKCAISRVGFFVSLLLILTVSS